MRAILILFILYFPFCHAYSQLLIKNTTVVDVENKKMLPSQSVVIDNGRIVAMGKNIKYKLQPGTQVIDGSGKYLVPGWVDAHVHFFQSGGVYTRPDAVDLRKYKSYETEREWTHRNMEDLLRRYIAAGITTVVDVGSSINFLKQRDSFHEKSYSPTVYMTGPLLTTWEPAVYKNLQDDGPFYEMKNQDDPKKYVQKQLPYKPDFIKIWYIVSGRNTDSSARKSLPLVQAVIDEAHASGLRVAVHATERITAQLAVEAGADFLVHGIDDEAVDAAFVQLLKSKKVVLCPTLIVGSNYNKVFGQNYDFKPWDFQYANPTPMNSVIDFKYLSDTILTSRYKSYVNRQAASQERTDEILRTNLKKLLDGGVIIATGTDAGNIGTQHSSSYFDELLAMQESGFDAWQLLQASTINGAKAVGKDAEFGSIKTGKRADMLVLDANPLDSIDNWRRINLVINKGIAIKPDTIIQYSPETLADQQLLAYNAHNLEAFLAPYANDVEVYTFPDKLQYKGKDQMRRTYQFITTTPKLYCKLLNRIVQGNMVIDHEEVWGFGDKPFYGVAIYEIKNGKISKVFFPR